MPIDKAAPVIPLSPSNESERQRYEQGEQLNKVRWLIQRFFNILTKTNFSRNL